MRIKHRALGGIGANCYFVTIDGQTAVIDPGYPSPWLLEKTREYGDSVKYILLTHRHADHLMGLSFVKEQTGAHVAVHELDAAATDSPEVSRCMEIYGKPQVPVQADILLRDGDTLPLGQETIKVLHTPGHSAGSVCFLIGDSIFSGDTLFEGTVGRTDLPSGDYSQMMASVAKLAALDGEYQVYPGHGGETTLNEERAHNPYFGNNHALFDD